jgi:heptosyltransferase I
LRVLIVKVSSLGDIVHALPAVTDASRANRDLVFDWVVEEGFTEIPTWHPAVDKVIPIALRRWRMNLFKTFQSGEISSFRKNLQQEHYDLVIDAQGLIKSGIISRMSRGLTIGLSDSTIREPLATMFYNKVYSVPWTQHAVDRIRELFSRILQYRYDNNHVDYGLDLKRIGIKAESRNQRRVVFLHGTTWKTKQWPEQYWQQLALLAGNQEYEILLPWGNEAEKHRAQRIADGNSRAIVLPEQTLSSLARNMASSAGVIGVDTGLGHLAAALSVPTLSLYGATNPDLSGTFGDKQLHLTSSLSCAPCMKKTCTYVGPEIKDEFNGETFAVLPPCFSAASMDR